MTAKSREEHLFDWGVKFYELGFQAAIDCVSRLSSIAKNSKVDAVQKYIEEELKRLDSS